MGRFLVCLLLPAVAVRARAQTVEAAGREPSRLILPGAPMGQGASGAILLLPTAPVLPPASRPDLVLPSAPVLVAPAPKIAVAARPLTDAEASPEADLKALAASLAPAGEPDNPAAVEAAPGALDSAFDGTFEAEAYAWNDVAAQFARGPLAPDLPTVAVAARSLIARLLPRLYRRVPVTVAYDRGGNPSTGHTWTPETGHVIALAPVPADPRGEVPSAFGQPNQTYVQQKIERLMQAAHEYFHVMFDRAVRRDKSHIPHSAYTAMTEGFAVSGEQLLIGRLLDSILPLGLGARDAMDLAALARARSHWLDLKDTPYAEGVLSWRKAYGRGGLPGLLEFLSSLSASRMAAVPRWDPAYQLALGEPTLLSAYLGRDASSPARKGLEAFAKAARGQALTEAEAREASAAAGQAGDEGWRRLFERTLLADRRLKDSKPATEPAFALARLSPPAGAALARFLARTISAPGGAARLFGPPGPSERLSALLVGAEALPWDEADRLAWNDGLRRWLTGVPTNGGPL